MKRAVAGKEPGADDALGAFQPAGLDEIPMVGDENVANQVGVIELIHMLRADAKMSDVAEFTSQLRQKAGRIAAKFQEAPHKGESGRARGGRAAFHTLFAPAETRSGGFALFIMRFSHQRLMRCQGCRLPHRSRPLTSFCRYASNCA